MVKKLIDKSIDEYTDDGVRCANEVLAALRVIKQKYVREGFSAKEIAEIVKETCFALNS